MEYVLQTHSLCKDFGDFKALNGLSMNVPKGSIYGFVGKNGAGKTTLIRLICGLQFPSSGNYSLFGAKAASVPKARKRMGAVVETPSIYLDMNAADNLRMQYRILGINSDEGIDELLTLVGLEDAGKKNTRNFSLGMKQRLGIAVALCGTPEFLILDEPVNGLDPHGIVEVRELILKLNREKKITVLISSHILGELSKMATHYGFIDAGRIVRELCAEDLDAACRKCVRINVSHSTVLAKALDNLKFEYTTISASEVDVFGDLNITEIVMALAKEHCEIKSIYNRNESLESFYLSLVGGESRD